MLFGLVERVERVEEFLLRGVFAGDELDVVHQQNVGLAVLFVKLAHGALANRVDELVGELVALDVQRAHLRVRLLDVVADGVQQVGLAEARVPVDEERVVGAGGVRGDGQRSGVSKFVRRAHDVCVEGQLWHGVDCEAIVFLRCCLACAVRRDEADVNLI